jgi:hypothetical protein
MRKMDRTHAGILIKKPSFLLLKTENQLGGFLHQWCPFWQEKGHEPVRSAPSQPVEIFRSRESRMRWATDTAEEIRYM